MLNIKDKLQKETPLQQWFNVVKPHKGKSPRGKSIESHYSISRRLHDGSFNLSSYYTITYPTMHYILHEISYMSKTVVDYAHYKNLP